MGVWIVTAHALTVEFTAVNSLLKKETTKKQVNESTIAAKRAWFLVSFRVFDWFVHIG